jgi:glucokinase
MERPYVIGIDIGGTNTEFGAVDAKGNIILRGGIGPKFKSGALESGKYETVEAYLAELIPELNKIVEQLGGKEKFNGIGAGAPDGNYYKGTIEDAVNIVWAKGRVVPFVAMVNDAIGIRAVLTNDANAAAVGEMIYGVAKGMRDFIMITLGTGVGSGIVVNGQVVYGHDGFAGELGHVIIKKENGRLCGCGRKGCLEAYTSAPGVAATAREYVQNGKQETILSGMKLEDITAEEVYKAAVKGDGLAVNILRDTGLLLGETFADFVAFSSPEAIILFGGLAKSKEFIIEPIKEAMEAHLMGIFKGKTKILVSELPESDAAILGASALAWDFE